MENPVDTLGAFFLLSLIGAFWLDSLRARERALAICRDACARRGLQWLDQTVALRRIGLSWRGGGLRPRRVYRFDFSEEGEERRTGYLILRGLVLEELSFGLPAAARDI